MTVETSTRRATWQSIPTGVWALGFVSLLMDLSSEMIHALLPVYPDVRWWPTSRYSCQINPITITSKTVNPSRRLSSPLRWTVLVLFIEDLLGVGVEQRLATT